MHGAGYGFQVQFMVLAVSASIVLLAAFFLPNAPVSTPVQTLTGAL